MRARFCSTKCGSKFHASVDREAYNKYYRERAKARYHAKKRERDEHKALETSS
jgi:hypothetical protein